MKKILCLILLYLSTPLYGKNKLDSILSVLDTEIQKYPQYEQANNTVIESIRKEYMRTDPSTTERYKLGRLLFEKYRFFNADSARNYLRDCLSWSIEHNDSIQATDDKLELAFYHACTGMYLEAIYLLKDMNSSQLSVQQRSTYYATYRKVYEELGNETQDKVIQERYRHLFQNYQDSLVYIHQEHSKDGYWYHKIDSLFAQGKLNECDKLLNSCPKNTRLHALIAYIIGANYQSRKYITEAMTYYAHASIADIQSNTKDHGALPILSNWLLEQGDIERAYQYISFSWQQTTSFGSKLRYISNTPTVNLIESTYKKMLLKRQKTLMSFTICISVLVILLLGASAFIYIQLRKNSKVKDKLKQSNQHLIQLNKEIKHINEQMQENNKELLLANTIKEKYLTHFIQLCSIYISDMDEHQRKIKKIILRGDSKEALRLAGSPELFEKELAHLYDSFDKAFLEIFPDFVTSFNALLHEDKQIVRKKNELLTTEIRIFALIKLGVTDYAEIAKFLRCSINTIYNYRTKIKASLKVSKEEFDAFIMK